jgi:alkylhydroperoxidase family enzyme
MTRLAPLPIDAVPELKEIFDKQQAAQGFVPNSMLVMQRRPKLVKAFRALSAAVFDPEGEVSIGFKRLLAYVVARTHGCHY